MTALQKKILLLIIILAAVVLVMALTLGSGSLFQGFFQGGLNPPELYVR